MKNLSKFEIGIIVAFVLVLIAGGAGWWYTGGMVEEAEQRLQTATMNKGQLQRQRFTPSAPTVQRLEESIEAMKSSLAPVEAQILRPEEYALAAATTTDPTEWQERMLVPAVGRMHALAQERNITLPPATNEGRYFFSFKRYANTTPPREATEVLSKQLLGIERAFGALAKAKGVREFLGVRRTFDEDARGDDAALSRSLSDVSAGREQLETLRMVKAHSGLYEVFPLEMRFVAEPAAVRDFLNNLARADLLYVVRSVTVTNSEMRSPQLSVLQETYAQSEDKRSLTPFGAETVTATVRFDLIDWLGEMEATDEEDARRTAQTR